MIELSIGIPVYNNFTYTLNTLTSLAELDQNYSVEVIVVDNGSNDQTQYQIPFFQKIKNFQYVRLERNYGFAYAVNKAWQKSNGQSFMMLNNDIKINNKQHWIQPILEELKQNKFQLISPTGGYLDPKTFDFKYETDESSKKINYLSGWCLSAKRETWNQLKIDDNCILDEKNYFVFFEDSDLGFRVMRQGILFKLVKIEVIHFGHKTSHLLDTNKLYLDGKSRFTKKWKGKV